MIIRRKPPSLRLQQNFCNRPVSSKRFAELVNDCSHCAGGRQQRAGRRSRSLVTGRPSRPVASSFRLDGGAELEEAAAGEGWIVVEHTAQGGKGRRGGQRGGRKGCIISIPKARDWSTVTCQSNSPSAFC